jgi:hypothetical protein
MLGGEPFWRAHREHYYQRLIRSGWSHRRTAICEYMLMAASTGFAVLILDWSPAAQYAGLAGAAAVYVALAWAVDRRWAAFQDAASTHAETERQVAPGAAPLYSNSKGVARPNNPAEVFIGEALKTSHRSGASALSAAGREHRARAAVDDRAFHDSESTEAKQL